MNNIHEKPVENSHFAAGCQCARARRVRCGACLQLRSPKLRCGRNLIPGHAWMLMVKPLKNEFFGWKYVEKSLKIVKKCPSVCPDVQIFKNLSVCVSVSPPIPLFWVFCPSVCPDVHQKSLKNRKIEGKSVDFYSFWHQKWLKIRFFIKFQLKNSLFFG